MVGLPALRSLTIIAGKVACRAEYIEPGAVAGVVALLGGDALDDIATLEFFGCSSFQLSEVKRY